MRQLLLTAICFSTLLAPAPAGAQFLTVGEVDFGLTESLYMDWHMDESFMVSETNSATGKTEKRRVSYDFMDIKNRLNISARSRHWQAGLRLDTAGIAGPGSGESGVHFKQQYLGGLDAGAANTDVRLEKLYLRLRQGPYGLEVGDVYGCLGKGIALCVKKVDELSTDTSLRGFKAYYNGRRFGATVIGGLANIVNVGDKIEQFLPDPNDLVGGAEVRVSPAHWLRLTGHAGAVLDRQELGSINVPGVTTSQDFEEDIVPRREFLMTVGPSLSITDIFGHGTFMVEYDVLFQTWANEFDDQPHDLLAGQAIYANSTFNWGLVNLLAELKWYESHLSQGESVQNLMGTRVEGPSGERDFVYYGVLPPLEDENLLFRNDQPWDVIGGRARVDLEIPPTEGGIAWVSYAHFADTDVGPELFSEYKVQHAMAGWEQRLDELSMSANFSGGYREEDYDHTKENMWHIEGDVHFPIFGPHSFEVAARREAHERPEQGVEFSLVQLVSTYSFAPWLGVSYTYEYSDQPPTDAYTQYHYHSAEVIYRFMSGSYAKIYYGASRGGLKCAGGQCRIFPPFEGAKGELTLRF
jgi:hypothetical protein